MMYTIQVSLDEECLKILMNETSRCDEKEVDFQRSKFIRKCIKAARAKP